VRETEPGVYAARFRVPSAGEYDVSFLLDTPLIDHCFTFSATPDPELVATAKDGVELEYLNPVRESPVGSAYPVRFSVTRSSDDAAVADLTDVMVIATRPPGSWQQRLVATSLGDGRYEVTIPSDEPGVYYVTVAIPSLGFDVTELPFMTFVAREPHPADTPEG